MGNGNNKNSFLVQKRNGDCDGIKGEYFRGNAKGV
jgi:hypothetical protein